MRYCYIVKESSEIPLKSHRTRPRFERRLLNNIAEALRYYGVMEFKIVLREGVITIFSDNDNIGKVVSNVFGVYRVCKALCSEFKDINDIAQTAIKVYRDVVKSKKFAVRVKRAGSHSFTSLDVAAKVGEALLKYSAGVNLRNPDVEVNIEVRDNTAYYILECWEGVKGLPVGVEGRVIALFSGGFDSTLASWLAGKRGCEVDFLHFFMGSAEATKYALLIAKELSKYFIPHKPKVYIIDLTPLLAEIRAKVRNDYSQVVLRWYMYYIARRLSLRYGYDAIVTGESVGQASSQTLRNLRVIEETQEPELLIPIIRPLAFMDKDEIISNVRKINLYELASRVKEVCRLSTGPVATRADREVLIKEVAKVSKNLVATLINSPLTVNVVTLSDYELNEVLESLITNVEIELRDLNELRSLLSKEDYVVVDARDIEEFRRWHLEGSIHISELLKHLREGLDLSKKYIIYCTYGTASLSYAKMLRRLGIEAYSVKGGLRRLGLK